MDHLKLDILKGSGQLPSDQDWLPFWEQWSPVPQFFQPLITLGAVQNLRQLRHLKRWHKMTEGEGVIQKMTDDNDSSFRRNGVLYILIKSINLFKNQYNMDISCIIRVLRVPNRLYIVIKWLQPILHMNIWIANFIHKLSHLLCGGGGTKRWH